MEKSKKLIKWKKLNRNKPAQGQRIAYEGNFKPIVGTYLGDNLVRLDDGFVDRFEKWTNQWDAV